MDQDPKQPLIGNLALWVSDINPNRSYWTLLFTDYGIYDGENKYMKQVLRKSGNSLLDMQEIMSNKTQLDAILEFLLWLYEEDESLCFEIMGQIYSDFKEDRDIPETYSQIKKLENMDSKNGFPEVDLDNIVRATAQVYTKDERMDFYFRTGDFVSQSSDEIFIIDAYANEKVIGYLSKAPEDVHKRILTQGKKEELSEAAEHLVEDTDHRIEVRRSSKCHDRLLFADNQCFAVGNSLHAGGGRKPMYTVEFESTEKFREPWEDLWAEAEEYAVFGG